MSSCTVKVAAGDDIAPHLAEGAVVCLGAGRHQANLHIRTSLRIEGEPGVVLDGGGRGPVLMIDADGIEVAVSGVEVTNGAFETGSGILIDGYARVTLDSLSITGNHAGKGGGGGMTIRRGFVRLERSTIDDEVILTNTAQVDVSATTLADLQVLDGAKVTLTGGSVAKLTVRGTSTREPELTVSGTEIDERA